MPFTKGNYRVTRWCCTSGLCVNCHARGNHGDLDKRRRVVQTEGASKKWARQVVLGWTNYAPVIEEMKFNAFPDQTEKAVE